MWKYNKTRYFVSMIQKFLIISLTHLMKTHLVIDELFYLVTLNSQFSKIVMNVSKYYLTIFKS